MSESSELKTIQALVVDKRYSEAMKLISSMKAQKSPLAGLDFLRAIAFAGMARPMDALEAAKEGLHNFPNDSNCKRLYSVLQSRLSERHEATTDPEFLVVYNIIKSYTMLGQSRLYSLYSLAKQVCDANLPGDFVECGVAGGGASALLGHVIKKHSQRARRVYSCDTFSGMPEATLKDTSRGVSAQDLGWGAGTCAAPVESLAKVSELVGAKDVICPVKGLFRTTLPILRYKISSIALLHADSDWYDSTLDIFENLYELIEIGGIVQVDDYGYWDGCKEALRVFMSRHYISSRLNRIDASGVWFQKELTEDRHAIPMLPRTWEMPHKGIPTSNSEVRTKSTLLNLGCGRQHHKAWMNVDMNAVEPGIIRHDVTTRLPFPDNSFRAVYHSHLLEHLPRMGAPFLISECFRVLQEEGILRVVVPDLETIARLYLENLEKAEEGDCQASHRHEWMTLELLDQMVRETSGGEMLRYLRATPLPAKDFVMERLGEEAVRAAQAVPARGTSDLESGQDSTSDKTLFRTRRDEQFLTSGERHQWMYDRRSLRELLRSSGFINIQIVKADVSRIPGFSTYQLDCSSDGSIRKPDSLFMEATKPWVDL